MKSNKKSRCHHPAYSGSRSLSADAEKQLVEARFASHKTNLKLCSSLFLKSQRLTNLSFRYIYISVVVTPTPITGGVRRAGLLYWLLRRAGSVQLLAPSVGRKEQPTHLLTFSDKDTHLLTILKVQKFQCFDSRQHDCTASAIHGTNFFLALLHCTRNVNSWSGPSLQ
jgi:hypothetical protein